jgi:hypothetical protein
MPRKSRPSGPLRGEARFNWIRRGLVARCFPFRPIDFNRPPAPKCRVLLIVVAVRSARPSLWYCLMREFLESTCQEGTTLSVITWVRNGQSRTCVSENPASRIEI